MENLANTLVDHIDGILNYFRTRVPFGVVEAVKGNIRMLINRGQGYKNMRYLPLKAKRMAATKTEFVAFSETGEGRIACESLQFLRRAVVSSGALLTTLRL